jgi:flagellar hook-length control protein FliK
MPSSDRSMSAALPTAASALPGTLPGLPSALPAGLSKAVGLLPGSAAPGTPALPASASKAQDTAPAGVAADLARLIATLSLGNAEGAPGTRTEAPVLSPELPALSEDADPADAIAALCMEIGLATLPPREPELPAQARGIGDAVAALATSQSSTHLGASPAQLVKAADALAAAIAAPAEAAALLVDPAPAAEPAAFTPPGIGFALPPIDRAAATPVLAPTVVDIRLPQAPQQIAETVVWQVAEKGVGEVRIHLSPEDLGPLDVHLKLDGDKVAVRFDTADESVRDVVQTSLPQLATLLSARGLQLDQAQVFSQSRGQQQMPQPPFVQNGREGGGEDASESGTGGVTPMRMIARRGLVDDYV